jgi:hypothetical protein
MGRSLVVTSKATHLSEREDTMIDLDSIVVDERIALLERRMNDLEQWLTEVAADVLDRFGIGSEADNDTTL